MHLLQIGYPKSGNYWLYTILKQMLDEAGVEDKSFIRNEPIYQLAKDWKLSYPEQVDINMIDIYHQAVFYRISSRYRSIINNMQDYVKSNRHVWSHSDFCERSKEVFPLFDKVIYIIRDPRDILLSEARFAFSSYMQEYWPTVYTSVDEYIRHEAFKIGKRWKYHVTGYLDHAQQFNIHMVFYEQLLTNLPAELERLRNYLGLHLQEDAMKRVREAADFENMKKESPQHVRKARLYGWKEHLDPKYLNAIEDDTFILLEHFGYPMKVEAESIPELG